MPRYGILNMAIGFAVLLLAAAGGSFVAFDLTEGFLKDPSILSSWQTALLQSAHGHTNMFGMIHILVGLTLPYTKLPPKWQLAETLGFLAGTLAMGPGMMLRAYGGPSDSLDITGLIVGTGLSLSMIALGLHSSALFKRLLR